MSKNVTKKENIRNRYNKVTHLTQDTLWKSDKSTRKLYIQKRLEVSPFPAGDVKAVSHRQGNILGQKRNAAYKTYIIYEDLSPIPSKRFVTVRALILGLWVPGVVLDIIVTGQN